MGIVALAAGALAVQRFPLWVPALILGCGTAINLLGHHFARTTGQMPLWVHLGDLSGCLLFPALLESTTLPAVAVMMAVVSLSASISGLDRTLVLIAYGAAGLTLVALTSGLPDATVTVVAFTIAAAMVATAVGRLASTESDVRNQLNTTVDNLDAILWIRRAEDQLVTYVNQRAVTMLGWTTDEWQEPGFWLQHLHPEDVEAVAQATQRAMSLGVDHEVSYRFRAADERWVHLHDRVSVTTDGNGRTTALQGMSLDISEQVRIEQRVNQYADIVEGIDLALLVLRIDERDPDVLLLGAANAAAEALVGRSLTPLVGTTIEEAFPVLAGSRLRTRLAAVASRNTAFRVDDLLLQPPSGPPRVITLRAFPLPGRSVGVSLLDVTDAVAASEALRRQALYDGLTGLPNRRLLDEELHRAVRDTPVSGETLALLMMDLDQFKEVNDALGHQVGDRLLREIGLRLARDLDDALVARLGGDEFAVVLAGHIDEAAARAVAERVRTILAEPFLIDDVRLQTNASIGIALFPSQAQDVATLIQRADVAMYLAKRTGTGVAVYAAENDRSSVERLTLIGDLPDAVPAGQLVLHFQPCFDLRTGRAVRAEALVRWNHPRLGLLGPDQFIELAELSGAIQPLTRWVIEESLRSARAWHDAGHELGVAVNLSVRNLYDPGLVPHLADTLARTGLPPESLVLELTETELMDDPSLAREVFTALGDLGVSTSIDDFGTGYSSLTYLRDLPLQEIKVDRSFVSGMHRRSDEFTIVRSMIDLGHNLGLEVVAEGVEHADDLALLQRLGCDLAQGFHLSRPLPQGELLRWLDQHARQLL
ncbi:EAL domain-containing protein [Aquihabitans sp. G128]|uniref:putative bifunctional diguanylate cyclase/phosphodiesterase n=1 Tax=Aquihabitans sp. G128 TaxID=2849779 RepID=UPI001C231F41|nr:GGDEF domain-containing phosphodiesterase [Aquihabitans sp. G128]QXC61195.1 EAL domain-containing protein [Aquihabitans sp. G128]